MSFLPYTTHNQNMKYIYNPNPSQEKHQTAGSKDVVFGCSLRVLSTRPFSNIVLILLFSCKTNILNYTKLIRYRTNDSVF